MTRIWSQSVSDPSRCETMIIVRPRQAGSSGDDVVADRSPEQEVILQHDAESLSEVAQVDFAKVHPVQLEEAAVIAVDTLQKAGDRRFPRSASPDDAEHAPGRN